MELVHVLWDWGLGFRAYDLGLRVKRFRAQGLRFTVQGLGCRASVLGCRVSEYYKVPLEPMLRSQDWSYVSHTGPVTSSGPKH